MKLTQISMIFLTTLAVFLSLYDGAIAADDWITYFERTDSLGTPRYEETVRYFQRLADTSPFARMTSFGTSPEGRELPLMIISKDQHFTPEAAIESGKPIILIQCCIHPGESEGKDAVMLLARDMLIYKRHATILENNILMIIPIFNVDGHERFGPYNRINQNGPTEMGWRVTATRLNLNRDFMKAESPEMRAWLRLFHEWLPHLVFDCHTTDGLDHQYVIAYNIDEHADFGGAVSVWAHQEFVPALIEGCARKGHLIVPYSGFFDEEHPEKGIRGGVWPPMLSNPYVTLNNRAGVLIETHSLKPYPLRVRATYDFLLTAMDHVSTHPRHLLDAVSTEDRQGGALGAAYDPEIEFPLTFNPVTNRGDSMIYRGYRFELKDGVISGEPYIAYTNEPSDFATVFFNEVSPNIQITPPLGYLIPAPWTDAIEVLEAHGAIVHRLSHAVTDTFETYRFKNVRFSARSFEGRHRPAYETVAVREAMTFPAGSAFVPLGNQKSKIVMHLLEPQAPDALVGWGFFNTIFEHKEYFEAYVMEPMAQQMIAEDDNLRGEFERKLASDSTFAANPRARLQFFYERSPYWDTEKDRYPVARITSPIPRSWLAK